MSLYRIKQFYWSITAKINEEDINYLKKYLNDNEIALFNELAVIDQKHSINVAKNLEKYCDTNKIKKDILVKSGILHDIGKVGYKSNVFNKSIMVLLNKFTKGKVKKYKNIKMVDMYYNHAELGYNILKGCNSDDELLYLIKNHHNTEIKEDIYLDLLKKYDSNN